MRLARNKSHARNAWQGCVYGIGKACHGYDIIDVSETPSWEGKREMDITFDLGWLRPSTLQELLEDARTMVDGAADEDEMWRGAKLVVALKKAIRES